MRTERVERIVHGDGEWCAAVFVLTALGAGLILETAGAWFESNCLDARARVHDSSFARRWDRYLLGDTRRSGVDSESSLVAHRYVHDRVLFSKCELAMGLACVGAALVGAFAILAAGFGCTTLVEAFGLDSRIKDSWLPNLLIVGGVALLGRYLLKQAELSHRNLDSVRVGLTGIQRRPRQGDPRVHMSLRARVSLCLGTRFFDALADPREHLERDVWSHLRDAWSASWRVLSKNVVEEAGTARSPNQERQEPSIPSVTSSAVGVPRGSVNPAGGGNHDARDRDVPGSEPTP